VEAGVELEGLADDATEDEAVAAELLEVAAFEYTFNLFGPPQNSVEFPLQTYIN